MGESYRIVDSKDSRGLADYLTSNGVAGIREFERLDLIEQFGEPLLEVFHVLFTSLPRHLRAEGSSLRLTFDIYLASKRAPSPPRSLHGHL